MLQKLATPPQNTPQENRRGIYAKYFRFCMHGVMSDVIDAMRRHWLRPLNIICQWRCKFVQVFANFCANFCNLLEHIYFNLLQANRLRCVKTSVGRIGSNSISLILFDLLWIFLYTLSHNISATSCSLRQIGMPTTDPCESNEWSMSRSPHPARAGFSWWGACGPAHLGSLSERL